jgi:hypothetical protein
MVSRKVELTYRESYQYYGFYVFVNKISGKHLTDNFIAGIVEKTVEEIREHIVNNYHAQIKNDILEMKRLHFKRKEDIEQAIDWINSVELAYKLRGQL